MINNNRGGFRPGSGRKKGVATIEREKAKDYIAQRIGEYMPQLFQVILNKALDGDIQAARELFDRAWGKARQDLGFDATKPLLIQISEAIAKKNQDNEDEELLDLPIYKETTLVAPEQNDTNSKSE